MFKKEIQLILLLCCLAICSPSTATAAVSITDSGIVSGLTFKYPSGGMQTYVCIYFTGVDRFSQPVTHLNVGGGTAAADANGDFDYNPPMEQFTWTSNTNGSYTVKAYLDWADCLADQKELGATTFYRTAANDDYGTVGHWSLNPQVPGPHIDSVSPNPALFAGDVTIVGTHFGDGSGDSTVLFDSQVVSVVSWSDTNITVKAPNVAGDYEVTVNADSNSNLVAVHVTGLNFPLAQSYQQVLSQTVTAYTHPISAVFDHHSTITVAPGSGLPYDLTTECFDGFIVSFTGEQGGGGKRRPAGVNEAADKRNVCELRGPAKPLFGYDSNTNPQKPFVITGAYTDPAQKTRNGKYVYGTAVFLDYDGHTAYDYPTFGKNVEVRAAASGKVKKVGCFRQNDSSCVGAVDVEHGTWNSNGDFASNGYMTRYLHLSKALVGKGAHVDPQTIIGRSGDTGAQGIHLHFEVRKLVGGYWKPVDPYGWFPNTASIYRDDPYSLNPGMTNELLWEKAQ